MGASNSKIINVQNIDNLNVEKNKILQINMKNQYVKLNVIIDIVLDFFVY